MAELDWTYSVAGVSVVVEDPGRVFSIWRAGPGTHVEQAGNTSNWFHFAVPTPNKLNGGYPIMLQGFFKVRLNNSARITRVHVWIGNRKIVAQDGLDLKGPEQYYETALPREQIVDNQGRWAGISICVHVEFLMGEPMGMVVFEGAGATFLRWGSLGS